MGPRPDGRGRYTPSRTAAYVVIRQWGRGRMAAEGWLMAGPRTGGHRQWGRGRMAAEGRWRRLSASPSRVRQWGRGRMAAEG